jgi:hypothetical protein
MDNGNSGHLDFVVLLDLAEDDNCSFLVGCNNYKTTFEKFPMKFQFLSFSEQIMRSLFGLSTNIPAVM